MVSAAERQAHQQDNEALYGGDTTPYYGEFQSYTAHYGRAISSAPGVEKVGAVFMAAVSLAGDFFRGLGYILSGGDWKVEPSFFRRDIQAGVVDPATRTLVTDTVTDGGARRRRSAQPE